MINKLANRDVVKDLSFEDKDTDLWSKVKELKSEDKEKDL